MLRSDRELIEYVRDRLIEQGGKSVGENRDSCLYTSDDGRHCAAGWLMDLSVLDSEYNGVSIFNNIDYANGPRAALLAGGVLDAQIPLVARLQSIHDCLSRHLSSENWAEAITAAFKLELDAINDGPAAA